MPCLTTASMTSNPTFHRGDPYSSLFCSLIRFDPHPLSPKKHTHLKSSWEICGWCVAIGLTRKTFDMSHDKINNYTRNKWSHPLLVQLSWNLATTGKFKHWLMTILFLVTCVFDTFLVVQSKPPLDCICFYVCFLLNSVLKFLCFVSFFFLCIFLIALFAFL